AHITKATDTAITEGGLYDLRYHGARGKDHDMPATLLFPCNEGFYGYVLWVDQGFETMWESDKHPDLVRVFAFARAQDCQWVRFDCDEQPIAELPTYEWT
ncbi:MAG TPA: hypothetical protein VFO62_03865, partial [Candidatus Binatia bacterium]|nr:hypothetical protein [Candidatus Binatia bacterium]